VCAPARAATRVPARPVFRVTGSPSRGPCLCLAPGFPVANRLRGSAGHPRIPGSAGYGAQT